MKTVTFELNKGAMIKVVPLEKQSKRKQKEERRRNRIMFGHQNCPIWHKSAKDKDRKKEKENLKKYLTNGEEQSIL